MMRSKQQQPIHFSKQHSLLLCSKSSAGASFREGALGYGADEAIERDVSPVSVISHSATVVSQPSSTCASMEHLLARSGKPRPARSSTQQSPLSQSAAASGASTSEDDSTTSCDMSIGFIAAMNLASPAPPLQDTDLSSHKTQLHYKEGLASRNFTNQQHSCEEEAFAPMQATAKPIEKSSSDTAHLDNATDKCNTEDERNGNDHMFSIDLQGLKLDHVDENQNFVKRSGMKVNHGNKPKHSVEQLSATSKHDSVDLEENHRKRNMSTPTAPSALSSTKPFANWLSSKVVNHGEGFSNSRAAAALNVKKYEAASFQTPVKAFNFPPSAVSRQRSLHCGILTVPSKWDDAEKWLCYDNRHVSHHQNEAKSPSASAQTSLSSYSSTPNSGETLGGASKHGKCTEDSASPSVKSLNVDYKAFESRSDHSSSSSREKLSVRKVHRNVDNAGTHSILSRHSSWEKAMSNSSKGHPFTVGAALSKGNVASSPQSSSSNEMFANGRQTQAALDSLKAKRKEAPPQTDAFPRSVSSHTSSGEIANAQFMVNCRSSAVSVSDGETSHQSSCKQHCTTPPISALNESITGEQMKIDGTHPVYYKTWIRNNMDGSRTTARKCSQATSGAKASDREVCETEAPGQHLKSSPSYTQRFKQHQILQRLKRKCSKKQGALPAADAHLCKAEEDAGGNVASTNVSLQKEFMVQTPTHGRSASMKDAYTEVSPSLSRRDMGTQVTPAVSSSNTSKSASPLQNTSPARHNTPTHTSPTPLRQGNCIGSSIDSEDEANSRCNNVSELTLGSGHWSKLELRERPSGEVQKSENNSDLGSVNTEWSPAYGLEGETVAGKDIDEGHSTTEDDMHCVDMVMKKRGGLDARAAAWEESEQAKLSAKFKREEARIAVWENLQKAKAEAELKKLEVKLEKIRSKATAKVMSRVASAQKRAEEMRAVAELQQAEQIRKVKEKACSLRRNALFPGGFTVCFARTYMA